MNQLSNVMVDLNLVYKEYFKVQLRKKLILYIALLLLWVCPIIFSNGDIIRYEMIDGHENETMNGTIDGTMNGTMDETIDGTMNGTMNETINGTINGTTNGTMNETRNRTILGNFLTTTIYTVLVSLIYLAVFKYCNCGKWNFPYHPVHDTCESIIEEFNQSSK